MDKSKDRANVVNPPLLILGTLSAGFLLNRALALPLLPPDTARLVGVVIFFLGFLLSIPAAVQMRKAHTSPNPYKPTSAIVETGPFRYTRNPIYLSFFIHYTGIAIFIDSAWCIFLLPILVAMMTAWAVEREEAYLERKFGAEYIEYKKRVRRWF